MYYNFFKDSKFSNVQECLDSSMKVACKNGIGINKKQACVITREMEDKFWEMELLGDKNPRVLLNTMIYLNGYHFGLRSGAEHRSLSLNQLLVSDTSITYTEKASKCNQGGLKHRKVIPKKVTHHQNLEKPERCHVRLIKLYISHLPSIDKENLFYLTPLSAVNSNIWYSTVPVGHNPLSKCVSNLCKLAGFNGFFYNHSLRATLATRLYEENVDEQLIMERTGHRSVSGVRSYKRTSDCMKQNLSNIINVGGSMATSNSHSTSGITINNSTVTINYFK